jgi:TRAP-type C4-dicarboxylate transport system permease small subunit
MFAVLAWYGARMAWDDYRYEVTSPALGLPQWVYSVWLPLLSLAIVLRLLQMMRARLHGTADQSSKH